MQFSLKIEPKFWNDEVRFHRLLSLLAGVLLTPIGLIQVAADSTLIDPFFYRTILSIACLCYFAGSYWSEYQRRHMSLLALPIYYGLLGLGYYTLILNQFAWTYIIGHFILCFSVSIVLPTMTRLFLFSLVNLLAVWPAALITEIPLDRALEFAAFSATGAMLGYVSLARRLSQGAVIAEARGESDMLERRLRAIFENTSIGIYITDPNGRIISSNPRFCDLVGYDAEELAGLHFRELMPDLPEDDIMSMFGPTVRGERHGYIIERRYSRKDGGSVWVEVNVSSIRTPGGRVDFLVAMVRDISEMKRWEYIFDNAGWGILLSEGDAGRISAVNSTYARMIGYRREEMIGMHVGEIYPPGERSRIAELIRESNQSGGHLDFETHHPRKDGTLFPVQVDVTIVRDNRGQVQYRLANIQDITERRQSQEALRQARDAAQAANEAKSVFLSRMSHEIRTPLNAMIGAADLLPENAENERLIGMLKKGGVNLLSIVNDILEFSAVESGRVELSETDFHIHDLIRDTVTPFSPEAARRAILLESHIGSGVPEVIRADETKLRQVLLNLLGNALKFTESGRIGLHVDLEGPRSLLIRISDTGTGMAREELVNIFEPYFRGSTARQERREGSGLGLAITRSLVELLGGEISVESQPGVGSEFRFSMTFSPGKTGFVPRQDEPETLLGGRRVLIAEDNDVNAFLLERMVKELGGRRVEIASNGEEAARQFRERPFDIVLMDKQMPVMDGLAATRIIREFERDRSLPAAIIVAVTADAFEEDRRQCLDAGCDDCLSKPLALNAFRKTIAGLLSA